MRLQQAAAAAAHDRTGDEYNSVFASVDIYLAMLEVLPELYPHLSLDIHAYAMAVSGLR
jgi:hypothetical protein